MFWTRLLSGIVLLVIALATFSFGNIFLAVPLWLISLIAYRELTKALRCATNEKKFNALEWIGFVGVTAYYATLFFTRDHTLLLMCIVGLFMAEMFCYVALFPKYEASQVMAAVFSFLYAPVLLSFVYLTRECVRNLSGMADPDQFLGMRYLCLCRRKADREEAYFPGIKSS